MRTLKGRLFILIISSLCVGSYFSSANASSICSAGLHWVDSCHAGVAQLNVQLTFGVDTDLDAFADHDVLFSGVMEVIYSTPYAFDATQPNHLNKIDVEILSMNLSGASPFVSGWEFKAGIDFGLASSSGFIIEDASDSAQALNRFDLVFQIENTPYGTLSHPGTLFFDTNISGVPSIGSIFSHTGSPFGTTFPLFDSAGNSPVNLTDQIVTNFIDVGRPELTVIAAVPVPASILLFTSGVIILFGRSRGSVK